jgi:hypothetical protein
VAIFRRFFNVLLTRKPNKFECPIRVKPEVVQKKRRAEWRAQGDDFRTFLDDFAVAFSQIEFPRLNLFVP